MSLLTDDADVATWNNQGLPSDRMSTENATILCNTERWPLIVDAQLQGIKWIRNKYGEELKAIRLGQKRCRAGRALPGAGGPRRLAAAGCAGRRTPQGLGLLNRRWLFKCTHQPTGGFLVFTVWPLEWHQE